MSTGITLEEGTRTIATVVRARVQGKAEGAMNYYDEYKWCRKCNAYVNFLMAVDYSFCVHCDSRVLVFSDADLKKFHIVPAMVA